MPLAVHTSHCATIPSGVEGDEVWAAPFIPTPVEHIKVHPEGNRSSDEQGDSMPKNQPGKQGLPGTGRQE